MVFLGSVGFGLVVFAHVSGLVWPGLPTVSGLLAILVAVVLDCVWWVCLGLVEFYGVGII